MFFDKLFFFSGEPRAGSRSGVRSGASKPAQRTMAAGAAARPKRRRRRYRYGFNGKEMDNEVKGTGTQYDYGFRIYDPRLGKFLSIDPLAPDYPWYTPYQYAGNKPIRFIDLDGLEEADPDPFYLDTCPLVRQLYWERVLDIANTGGGIGALHGMNFVERYDYAMDLWDDYQGGLRSADHTVSVFNGLGRMLSTRNMLRYLEGIGGYDIYDVSTVMNSGVLGDFTSSRRNVVLKKLQNEISKLNAGTHSISIVDEKSRWQSHGDVFTDFWSAFGSFGLVSNGVFSVTISENGEYTYSGVIYYTFMDTYKWHDDRQGVEHFDNEMANHQAMNRLQQLGAANFWIRSYYEQTVSGSSSGAGSVSVGPYMNSIHTQNNLETSGTYRRLPSDAELIHDFRSQ